jgi:hypothetical protein
MEIRWSMGAGARGIAAAALLGGCFTDGNVTASASVGESVTESAGSTGTSGGETTGASASSTSGVTATSDPTATTTSTTLPTSGSDPTSETAGTAGQCPLDSACAAGEVEYGEPCDDCGLTQRTCTEACEWSAWSCGGPFACDVWHLVDGADAWAGYRYEEIPGETPSGPVEAAFAATLVDEVWILTADSIYLLDPETMSILDTLDRDALFPEAAGAAILHAFSTNHGFIGNGPASAGEDIYLVAADTTWVYTVDVVALEGELFDVVPTELGGGAQAPAPATIAAYWSDIQNTSEYVQIVGICDNPMLKLTRHGGAIVDDDSVRLQDFGSCFEYVHAADLVDFPPFALAGAPASAAEIAGVAYLKGLVAFGAHDG